MCRCSGAEQAASHLVTEGRKGWRIKEFLRYPEIISTYSVRGWRERNLLIPTLLKIDLVTGRSCFSQMSRCVIVSFLLCQKCWHGISLSAKTFLPFHTPWASHVLKSSEQAFEQDVRHCAAKLGFTKSRLC